MLSELDLTVGALEVGVFMASVLWGVTTVQLYVYIATPNKDPVWVRSLVYIIWTLESLHTIFVWIYLYRVTVTFYGVPAELEATQWSLDVSSLFDGIIGALVQMFFAYRIRMFSNSWPITLISWLGSLLQLADNIAVTIIASRTASVVEFGARYGWLIEGSLITNLIVDVINTAGLSYYLHRGRTGFRGTNDVVEKLVTWTIETGLLTAIAAAVELILSRVLPTTYLWIAISLFYAKLYSNAFLATLNSRSIIRRGFSSNIPQTGNTLSNNSWNLQSGVTVTVARTDDLELERVKKMNAQRNSDFEG